MTLSMKKIALVGISTVLLTQLTGCGTTEPKRFEKMSYEPSYPVNIPQQAQPNNGSLYQPGAMTLFDDARAHRVGDIITIQLAESITANKKGDASYDRTKNADYGLSTPLSVNSNGSIVGKAVSAVTSPFNDIGIGYGSANSFSGSSDVKQNSSVDGQIAVTVVEVIPNGNLVIRGEKWITIHDGDEVVQFAGIIRPDDIQPDNTIESSKVADVRLVYKEVGVGGDTARENVASKWLAKYWPF